MPKGGGSTLKLIFTSCCRWRGRKIIYGHRAFFPPGDLIEDSLRRYSFLTFYRDSTMQGTFFIRISMWGLRRQLFNKNKRKVKASFVQ